MKGSSSFPVLSVRALGTPRGAFCGLPPAQIRSGRVQGEECHRSVFLPSLQSKRGCSNSLNLSSPIMRLSPTRLITSSQNFGLRPSEMPKLWLAFLNVKMCPVVDFKKGEIS
jgi:hypothetical protein